MYGVERAPDVPIRVISEQRLLEELQDSAAQDVADPDDLPDATKLPHIERALVELGLLMPGDLTQGGGATAELVDRIDGVYQDAQRGIALVDRGRPKDDAETAAVLLHEFVHAIQDDLYGLDEWRQERARDDDSTLALRSVVEGQATYAQFRALYAMMGYDLALVDLSPALDEFRDRLLRSAYDDPSPFLASFTTFPYAAGVGPAARAWSQTGLHFAEQQFTHPPLTSLEALSDSFELDLTRLPPADLQAPELGDGSAGTDSYTLIDESRLGAFLFELFLHRQGISQDARLLARTWSTDRLWIYSGPEQRTAFLWEIELVQTPFTDLNLTSLGGVHEQSGPKLFIANGDAPPDFLLAAGREFLNTSR